MFPLMRCPRPVRLSLLAGCLGLFAGCASPSSPNAIMDRVDANRNEYETWPFEIKEAVLSGQVLRGMDPTMVLVARGKPAERIDRGNGDEVWVYRVRSTDSSSGSSILPRGSQISLGGSPTYPGGTYPGASYPYPYPGSGYPGAGYPGGGSGIYIPPIVLGGGGGNEVPEEEEEIVFHNGRVTHGDGVKK